LAGAARLRLRIFSFLAQSSPPSCAAWAVVAKEQQQGQEEEACGAYLGCLPQTLRQRLLRAKQPQKPALRFRIKRPAHVQLAQRS